MILINLFGGPGIGKTVLSADLFSILSKLGHNTELILEYAKSCYYENRMNILKEDQLYLLAKQHRSIAVFPIPGPPNKLIKIIMHVPFL